MKHVLRLGSLILSTGALTASGLGAQGLEELGKERIKFGVGGVLAVPVGEFHDFVDLGGGVNLSMLFNLDHAGTFGIRLDGAFLGYGQETFNRPLSNTIQRVVVEVSTTNWIGMLGAGPQITLGAGPLRPYAFGTVGFSYFATTTSVSGTADFDEFASTTNFDDFTFTVMGSAGVQLALSHGRNPVWLDLAAETMRNGVTEYLRPGSIRERADGSVFITPIESRTNMVAFRLGVVIGLR